MELRERDDRAEDRGCDQGRSDEGRRQSLVQDQCIPCPPLKERILADLECLKIAAVEDGDGVTLHAKDEEEMVDLTVPFQMSDPGDRKLLDPRVGPSHRLQGYVILASK